MGQVIPVRFPDGLGLEQGFWAAERGGEDGVLIPIEEWDPSRVEAVFLGNNPGNQDLNRTLEKVLAGRDGRDQYACVIQEMIIRKAENPIHAFFFGDSVCKGSIFLFVNGSLSLLSDLSWADATPETWRQIRCQHGEIDNVIGRAKRLIAFGKGHGAVAPNGFPAQSSNFKLQHPSYGHMARQVSRLNARMRREPGFCPVEELKL